MAKKVDINLLMDRMIEFAKIFRKLNKEILDYYLLTESSIYIFEILEDKEMTLKELTEMSKLDKSTISRQVNALVKNDFLLKTKGDDKRTVYIKMTNQAVQTYRKYRREADLAFDDLLMDWSEEEKQQLSLLLYRLNRSLSEAVH